MVAVGFLPEQSRRSVSCLRNKEGAREREQDMLCEHNACLFEGVCFAMGNLLLYCLQNNSSDSIDFL